MTRKITVATTQMTCSWDLEENLVWADAMLHGACMMGTGAVNGAVCRAASGVGRAGDSWARGAKPSPRRIPLLARPRRRSLCGRRLLPAPTSSCSRCVWHACLHAGLCVTGTDCPVFCLFACPAFGCLGALLLPWRPATPPWLQRVRRENALPPPRSCLRRPTFAKSSLPSTTAWPDRWTATP